VCSSRLGLNSANRLVAVATTIDTVTAVGHVFLVLDPRPFGLVPEHGRLPSTRERAEARPPCQDRRAARGQWGEQPPPALEEPELDEQAAIAAAYAEQRREPADLLHALAA
jgi:hypothetical protein